MNLRALEDVRLINLDWRKYGNNYFEKQMLSPLNKAIRFVASIQTLTSELCASPCATNGGKIIKATNLFAAQNWRRIVYHVSIFL